jgi:magnesium chelatase family protein
MRSSNDRNRLICPQECGGEAAWAGGLDILAPRDLLQLINHIKGTQVLSPPAAKLGNEQLRGGPDISEVKGQETAKRALEIAAAGGHNLLMIGPPGSGKSMLASCLPGILPPLSPREALEVSMIHSLAGTLPDGGLLKHRPFPRSTSFGVAACVDRRRASREAGRNFAGAQGRFISGRAAGIRAGDA